MGECLREQPYQDDSVEFVDFTDEGGCFPREQKLLAIFEAFRLSDTLCLLFCAKSYFYSAMRPHVVIFIVCPN